jgi:hypothetical protein
MSNRIGTTSDLLSGGLIIARGFRNEPARLRALTIERGIVEVAGDDPAKSIGLPKTAVYEFDEGLFKGLLEAFRNGAEDELIHLWAKARPYGDNRQVAN